jgi:Fe-S cluster assembly protein SufD
MMAEPFLDSLLVDTPSTTRAVIPTWLADRRRRAREGLDRDGLPGSRNEAWKYTSLRALSQRRYRRGDDGAVERTVEPALVDLPGLDGPRLVFVNGLWRADLSRLPAIDGLTVEPLATALARDDAQLRRALETPFEAPEFAFARLNTALADEGIVLRVAAGTRIESRVQLVFVGVVTEPLVWNLRVIVELDEDSALTLVEHHSGAEGDAHLGNLVSQVSLARGARLDLLQLQAAPETATRIRRSAFRLDTDATLNLRTLELGGALARHDLVVELAGDRARVVSRGVFAARSRQHLDTRIDVRHQSRDTACELIWRGIASGRARGVLHGAITVEAGADGADASLDTKNLLLSEQAEIDVQPVLEIHADEVKAAHGATVGQLDERALFYLRTRGIPAAEARTLLTLAFCRVAIDTLENALLREHIDGLLLERLPLADASP